jgi:sensor histidine kinase YesM
MKLALQVLADCLAVSLIVVPSIGLLTGQAPADGLVTIFAEVWLYTILIATPAHWVLPRLHPLIAERRHAEQWIVLIIVLAAISVAGSLVGSALVHWLNVEPEMAFGQLVSESVRLSMFLALFVGVIHAMVVLLQDRLRAVERKLHRQEVERERALKLATEARLAALEARVHPHFLFNALNTISSLIVTAPARAESLVERMSALLRFSLDANRQGLVTVRLEMKIVRDYLEVEQERFGPRLRFTVDMNDDVADKQVPPLSVQTLVENSVKYAVGPARDGADIRVRAASEGDWVRIEVADTGPGFAAADLPAGHGLDNLRSRLTVLFGDGDPLWVVHRDGWMTVGFRAPA